MIRVSEIKLSLEQAQRPDAFLQSAVARILGVAECDLADVHVFKRSFDARKADLMAVFIVDVTLADPSREAGLLAKFDKNPHVM
ncbi:MAG: FAD-dependent oxidoreductase, partial [Polaromonas sp.]|nr:FAD-dependent oxidoreductase [Polaromonas sp.]